MGKLFFVFSCCSKCKKDTNEATAIVVNAETLEYKSKCCNAPLEWY